MAVKMLVFFAALSLGAWILLFSGIAQRRESKRRNEQEHTRTTGIIVDYVPRESHRGKSGTYVSLKPVVEFTADGASYRAEYESGLDQAQFPIGTIVDISYDISDPSRFHLDADPVFISGGAVAIRFSLLWIAGSAILTVAFAVFIGGATVDIRHLWYSIRRFLRQRP